MIIDFSQYKQIVILTGAGVSTASGLHTYRGEGGIWTKYNVEEYGHVDRLNDHPDKIWTLFGPLRNELKSAKPNAAHYSLVALEKTLKPDQAFTLITQNIDNLHQQAGSRNVIECHGSILFTKCSNPFCDLNPYIDDDPHQNETPLCPECNHPLRPDIVLFGETIPGDKDRLIKRSLRDCDLFISIGTSGSVYPAANFVRSAQYAGARTICLNLEAMSPPNPAFKEEYLGKAEDILPVMFGINI